MENLSVKGELRLFLQIMYQGIMFQWLTCSQCLSTTCQCLAVSRTVVNKNKIVNKTY